MRTRLEREAAASGAGTIKGFSLYPESKGEPLRGFEQMRDIVRLGEVALVTSWRTQLGSGGAVSEVTERPLRRLLWSPR